MNEEWRPIPGWPGYEASDLGRIRSTKYATPRIRKPIVRRTGAVNVKLVDRDRSCERQVGAWVLEAFDGPAPAGTECSHRNGNPHDNQIGNLAWETHAENLNRKREHGTHQQGSRHGMSKLTEDDVRAIRKLAADGMSQYKIAEMFGTHQTNVSLIKQGRSWRHVE